jgi:hypothetical protein
MPDATMAPTAARTVRRADCVAHSAAVSHAIEDLYDDRLDVMLLRDALPAGTLASAGAMLDRDDGARTWARPNAVAPPQDIHILGTDTPATPTFSAPTGASLDAYLTGAGKHGADTAGVFPPGFDVLAAIERVLASAAGGRPVELARAADGRAFTPYTLRRLGDGKQIGLHHDYHYRLALYKELAPLLDTTTLVSWVFTLQPAGAGGELMVYALHADDADVPKTQGGWPDVQRADALFDHTSIATKSGDLFLLASGRCYHRVTPISGASRVTLGGFLAFDGTRERVVYWS